MRVLVISDIHSNAVALDTVLESALDFDAVWCLGDVVGYGPAPNECIERLRELDALCLAGNHDWAILGRLDIQEFNPDARQAILWTRHVLKAENLEWLANRPETAKLDEFDITLVHASPRQPIWEYIMSSTIAEENIPYLQTLSCLFGHTHVPMVFEQQINRSIMESRRPARGEQIRLDKKKLVNPGSVGQPRDHDPRASFAMLDLDRRALTFHRTEYDIGATQEAMANVDLPRRLIDRLEVGI